MDPPTDFQRWIARHGAAIQVTIGGFAAVALVAAIWVTIDGGAEVGSWLTTTGLLISVLTAYVTVRDARRAVRNEHT